jgi:hypothetical protein
MKKLLFLIAILAFAAGGFAQNQKPANAAPAATNDTVKPAAKPNTPAPATPALKVATSKEIETAPDVVLAKGNYFTGEVLVVGQSKIFLTAQENVFVWMREGKAVEVKLLKPTIYTNMIQARFGYKVYEQWPMIIKIDKEEFLVYYFATSGGGFYGLPDGTFKKEKKMKQSGVIRSQWLTDKEGVKEISSLKQLLQEMEKSSAGDYD